MTVRTDGSSRLADGNKWTTFPGISAGWRIIDEPFMDNVGFFDELKLRASWGIAGNTAIDPYQTAGRLAQTQYVFGNTPALGFRLNEIPNPDLGWERTSTVNAGVDFGILNGRVSGTIDYYVSNTTDLLLRQQLPFTSGYSEVLQNIGQTRTKGLEIVLSTVNFDTPSGFRWTTDINWGRNQEEIVELFNGAVDDVGSGWFIGQPIRVFYDYQKIGIWQANEVAAADEFDNSVPGEIKVADLDGDGRLEMILNGNQAGTTAPTNTYEVFFNESIKEHPNTDRYFINGIVYNSWEEVPMEYKVKQIKGSAYDPNTDPIDYGLKLRF
jgi:outer membrane receptor protein involved in Fe transport